jgi:hypothetical protein
VVPRGFRSRWPRFATSIGPTRGTVGAVPGEGSQQARFNVGRSSIPSGCVYVQALANQGVDLCRSQGT